MDGLTKKSLKLYMRRSQVIQRSSMNDHYDATIVEQLVKIAVWTSFFIYRHIVFTSELEL